MTVDVRAAKQQRGLSEEARRRLGKVYAFLLSLPDKKTADGSQAGEQGPSAAGALSPSLERANATEL